MSLTIVGGFEQRNARPGGISHVGVPDAVIVNCEPE
jgi:hypothetical protein